MKTQKKKLFYGAGLLFLCMALMPLTAFAAEAGEEYIPAMYATFWALVPPIVAIVLALITKEVYSSLFIGILVGGLFYSGFSFETTLTHIFNDGFAAVLSDSYNVGILIFLVILGAMVSLMNRAGGSAAFGHFAKEKIKSRAGADLFLGGSRIRIRGRRGRLFYIHPRHPLQFLRYFDHSYDGVPRPYECGLRADEIPRSQRSERRPVLHG